MEGTILDSELRPGHFNEVTCAIFQKLDLSKLFPSQIIHFTFVYLKEQYHRLLKLISLGHGSAQH